MRRTQIALLIPVFNEERSIVQLVRRCLEAGETARVDCRVFLYLDACTDQTETQLSSHFSGDDRVVWHTSKERRGKLAGLNFLTTLVQKESHRFVVLLDSDTEFEKTVLSTCLEIAEKTGAPLLVPQTQPIEPEHPRLLHHWSLACCAAYDKLRTEADKNKTLWFIPGYFLFFDAEIFHTLFPLHDANSVNDDAFIGWTLLKRGTPPIYCRDTVIRTQFPQNLASFWRQKTRVRKGNRKLDARGIPFLELRKKLLPEIRTQIWQTGPAALWLYYFLDTLVFYLAKSSWLGDSKHLHWVRIERPG